jgi:two-component system sensor histidine kinase KdpD
LLNSVSHEMRTPLTALIGSASALNEKGVMENPETRELLTTEIVSSAKRLNRVVENLLDLSRLERSDLALKLEWFTWEEIFHELKNISKQDFGLKYFTFEGNLEDLMEGDYTLLLHAFTNLASNAARYAGLEAQIKIVLDDQTNQHFYKIYFYDNGPGIQKEFKHQVFDKFFRLPNAKAGGLGLGLAIVKNIFELHEGSIELSDKFGGACFLVSLPRKKIPASVKDLVDGK